MRSTALAIAVAAIPASSAAATCPAPDAEQRLAYLERALDRAERDSSNWGHFWRATFQTTAAVQFGLSLRAKTDADRIDLVAGGIKSSVGFVFALVFQLPAERHSGPWADRPWREGDVCTRLAAAETAIERDAKFEKRGRSIGMQALGLGFNLGVGVITYFMHKRLWSVALATVTGSIVGELRIYTQPTVASDALANTKVSVVPVLVPQPGGMELGVAAVF